MPWLITFIGLLSVLSPTIARNQSYAASNLVFATSADPFQMENQFNSNSNMRTGRFANSQANSCTTTDGFSGTCMSRFHCMRLGGTVKGFCATFAGICCETNLQCGQTSRLKRTIIRNPTQLTGADCSYEIESYKPNVCQLLVEFENFELLQPTLTNTNLECTDYMEIGNFRLCGVNTQQHLYIPFNSANVISTIPLVFHTPSRGTQTSWRLVLTQLECPAVKKRLNLSFLPFMSDNSLQDTRTLFSTRNSDLDLIAPPGCDQYFRQTMGTIKSFNFNENLASFYMANLNYVICIKASSESTTVQFTLRRFSLSLNTPTDDGFDSDCHPTVFTQGRQQDYLHIPQSTLSNANLVIQPSYYCGTSLNEGDLITATAPFVVFFSSDGITTAVETGFSMDYRVKSILG